MKMKQSYVLKFSQMISLVRLITKKKNISYNPGPRVFSDKQKARVFLALLSFCDIVIGVVSDFEFQLTPT